MADHVDVIVEQWARQRPDLDVAGNATLARLLRAARFLELRMASVFAAYGLVRGEFDVLASLRRAGPPFALTPTRLSQGLLLSTSAMTNRLDRLEAMGLVRREPDDRDGRVVRVRLTRKGRTVIDELFPALLAEDERFLHPLPAGDRRALDAALKRLLTDVEDRSREPAAARAVAPGRAGQV